jgi:subtilase family serine protease
MSPRALALAALSTTLLAAALVAAPAQGAPGPEAVAPDVAATSDLPKELTFTVALPYDRRALHRAARQISSPGKSRYRQFLSLKQASQRYGATTQQRTRLSRWAQDNGMSVRFDATGLTARIRGPVDTWRQLFDSDVVIAAGAPTPRLVSFYMGSEEAFITRVPSSMRGVVAGIIPVANRLLPAPRAAFDPPRNEGSPFGPGQDCLDGELGGIPFRDITYSPRQLHTPYGTSALHRAGDKGKGANLAIVAVGQAYDPGLSDVAAECFDFRAPPVTTTGAFGMPDSPVQTSGSGGIESNLDLQTSSAVLPQAQGIGFVEAAGGASFVLSLVDGFTSAYQRLEPDVITLSYGTCMAALASNGDSRVRWMSDDVFALGAVVGTSILIATGDSGSSACLHNGIDDPGFNVGYPAASPWVTAVGGTRLVLGEGNSRVKEVVWNDSTWSGPLGDDSTAGAGTGGPTPYSVPWYQAGVTSQDRRVVPDVVAHASGFPGWPVVMTPAQFEDYLGIPVPPGIEWAMAPVGGTSASTPFTASNIALIAARHGRLGFLNPWLYGLAGSADYDRAFYDVTEGINQVAPPAGCCRATPGFDPASGLGAPAFDQLMKLVP